MMNLPKGSATYEASKSLMLLSLAAVAGFSMTSVFVDTPVLVILSCPVVACSLWLMQKTVGLFNFRALTIPGFCYLVYLAVVLVPSFFVFADQRDPFRLTYLFAVESALLTIPLGILSASRIFRFQRRETITFFSSPMQDSSPDPSPEIYFLFLGLAWVITCLYLLEVRTIPLFYLLAHPGQSAVLIQLREDSLKLLNSPFRYAYFVLRSTIYPFLVVLGFGRYLQTRRLPWSLLFSVSLASGLLFAGFAIAKGPVAAMLLMLCACFYLHRRGRVGTKFITSLVTLVLAFPLFVILQEYKGSTDFFSALQGIAHRIFYLPAQVLYYYFEIFPHVVPYQHGYTIEKFAMLMGDQPFDSANYVGWYIWPHGLSSVNANAPFLGNLNADFGMTGVLVGGFVAGFIMQATQIYLVRRSKSVTSLAIYSVLLINFADINSSPLPIVLLSSGTMLVLVLGWVMETLDSIMFSAARMRMAWGRCGREEFEPPAH